MNNLCECFIFYCAAGVQYYMLYPSCCDYFKCIKCKVKKITLNRCNSIIDRCQTKDYTGVTRDKCYTKGPSYNVKVLHTVCIPGEASTACRTGGVYWSTLSIFQTFT